ncbi:hypothetical protein FQR65_LT09887 [Abscondita terminalis]|nr:hypothetical protein FQR65_LT09887 [Abscondita terminalis]
MDRVKYLLLVFFYLKVVFGDPQQECLQKNNLKQDELYSALTNEETPLDSTFGKFFVCLWQEMGVLKQDGSVDIEQLQKFGENEIDKIRDVTDSDRTSLAKKLSECDLKPLPIPEHTAIKIKNCHMNTIIEVL